MQYGKDYDYDSPVKLLDKLLHSMERMEDEQLAAISHTLGKSIELFVTRYIQNRMENNYNT